MGDEYTTVLLGAMLQPVHGWDREGDELLSGHARVSRIGCGKSKHREC